MIIYFLNDLFIYLSTCLRVTFVCGPGEGESEGRERRESENPKQVPH